MWPALQDQLGELGGAWTDRRRLTADPLDGPLGIASMRTRHVFGDRGMPATTGTTQVNGDALAFAEQLDGMGGDARVELLSDQPVRHRVIVPVDVDVIIGRDATDPPLGIFVRLGGERSAIRAWFRAPLPPFSVWKPTPKICFPV